MGGQDASKVPDKVPPNAVYKAVNISVKNGVIQPRWAMQKKELTFERVEFYDIRFGMRTLQQTFDGCKFQAQVPYKVSGQAYVVVVIAGHICMINLTTMFVSYIPITDGSILDSRAPRINWETAEDTIVFFDFPALPVLMTGIVARRSDRSANEVPVSTLGTYNQSRMFIANNGNEFSASDAKGNQAAPGAPFSFLELETPGSTFFGQVFSLTTNHFGNNISAMGFLQQTDTSTGIGTMLAATDQAIWAYPTSSERSSWEAGRFGSIVVNSAGIVGPRALENVNGDMFFMSADRHIRTLSMSRDEQGSWARVPISREIDPWLVCHDKSLLKHAFIRYFSNKIFFSVNPYRVVVEDWSTRQPISDYVFGGVAVMEFDNFVDTGKASKPTWAGLWTGVRPMDMCTIDERCFMMGKYRGKNTLWEINPELTYDTADGKIRYVHSRIYTREHDFKDPFLNKTLHSFDLNTDSLQGELNFDIHWKPAHWDNFLHFNTFKMTAPWRTKQVPASNLINGFSPQMIRDVTLTAPEAQNKCNPATDELLNTFRKVQFRLDITAKYWQLHEYRAKAAARAQNENITKCKFKEVTVPLDPNTDWETEDFGPCLEM